MYTRSTWCGTFPAVRFSLTTISMGIPEKQIFVFDTVIFLWQFRYCRITRCPETANSSSLDLFIHSYLYLLLLLFPTVFFLFFFCFVIRQLGVESCGTQPKPKADLSLTIPPMARSFRTVGYLWLFGLYRIDAISVFVFICLKKKKKKIAEETDKSRISLLPSLFCESSGAGHFNCTLRPRVGGKRLWCTVSSEESTLNDAAWL